MSLPILFQFLSAKHISGIGWVWVVPVLKAECFSLQHGNYSKPAAPNLQYTTNWEQNDRRGNSTTQSQAPDDGYINVQNMLSA